MPYYNIVAGRTDIDLADKTKPERVGHHCIDMARAWLLRGDREQTLTNLNRARAWSPFNTRHHPGVRGSTGAKASSIPYRFDRCVRWVW